MIVSREDASRQHMGSGAWGSVTLDQLLRQRAEAAPDRLALADFADRDSWTSGAARQLTFAELDAKVSTLAAFFGGLGFGADSVIGYQMPATTDAVIVLLAAWRAGLVVAPLPLAWREAEVIDALGAVGTKAIATVAGTVGEWHGERMRNIAAELFQIRFVFGIGGDLPDGLVDLDRVFDEAASLGQPAALTRKGNPADHVATIGFPPQHATGREPGFVALPRSHNQWIAAGRMVALEAGIGPDSVVVTPFAPTGLTGFATALAPWLITGSSLVLGLPASVDRLAEEAVAHGASHVVAPARFGRRLADRLSRHRSDAALVLVAAAESENSSDDAPMPRGRVVIDVTTLGEYALVALGRGDGGARRTIPTGTIGAPSNVAGAATLVEARIKGVQQKASEAGALLGGELTLRGAMVPDQPWPHAAKARSQVERDSDGWVSSGLAARLVETRPPAFEPAGTLVASTGHGLLEVDLAALDAVYRSIDGVVDAAAIAIGDAVKGDRLVAAVVPKSGIRFDPDAFRRAVEALRLGLHKIPADVIAVPAIARSASGAVLRPGMAMHLKSRIPQQPGK